MADIIKLIVREYGERVGGDLGTTQLVKLFYLLECLFYQQKGRRLTNIQWLYYHYGPYAPEISQVIWQDPELYRFTKDLPEGRSMKPVRIRREDERLVDPRDMELYDRPEPEREDVAGNENEEEVRRVLGPVIMQWGDKNLSELLDYVYFETAPMRDAVRGQVLDIRKSIEDTERPRLCNNFPAISKKKLSNVRRLLEQGKERLQTRSKLQYAPANDPDLLKAYEALRRDDDE